MKFSVGYRYPSDFGSMVDIFRDHAEHLAECYFALPGDPSGRAPLGVTHGELDPMLYQLFWREIKEIVSFGVKPVLLFNAACYGKEAVSESFQTYICETIRELQQQIGLAVVTTTSPFVARVIKESFPQVEVRASVNMRLSTLQSLEYLEQTFDSFYVAKEVNRNIPLLTTINKWSQQKGKKIHLLANSGCLAWCPWQNFHDNMVAHESEIVEQQNVSLSAPSPCWDYMKIRQHQPSLLRNTWIRPDDIGHYTTLCEMVKLATRSHDNPRLVVEAYINQAYAGNLLCLFEPSFLPVFEGRGIDNNRFPTNWFEKTAFCERNCDTCSWCDDVFQQVLIINN